MREQSKYINMRKFHNRIKFSLLSRYVMEFKRKHPNTDINVLDVSVGRFGDIHNYIKSGVNYVLGIDPDEKSIEEAENRLMKTELDSELIVDTITNKNVQSIKGKQFSIVACHFTLHYFFESEEMLRNALLNISKSLIKGGYFIGTTIDGKRVDSQNEQKQHYQISKLYSSKEDKIFNLGYKFKLIDNKTSGIYFEDAITDKIEYLVNIEAFSKIAEEYNLIMINTKNFWKYPYQYKSKFNTWEKDISTMNVSFVFLKK